VHVPLAPFAALGAVRAHGVTGQITSLPDTAISVDPHARPARLVRTASLVLPPDLRPTNGIEIGFTAGFGAAPGDVPAPSARPSCCSPRTGSSTASPMPVATAPASPPSSPT
jgi:uncharacterized phiE125 gp8 family phage protein